MGSSSSRRKSTPGQKRLSRAEICHGQILLEHVAAPRGFPLGLVVPMGISHVHWRFVQVWFRAISNFHSRTNKCAATALLGLSSLSRLCGCPWGRGNVPGQTGRSLALLGPSSLSRLCGCPWGRGDVPGKRVVPQKGHHNPKFRKPS